VIKTLVDAAPWPPGALGGAAGARGAALHPRARPAAVRAAAAPPAGARGRRVASPPHAPGAPKRPLPSPPTPPQPDALAALKRQLQGHPGLAALRGGGGPAALAGALRADPALRAAADADPALAALLAPDTIASMAAALDAAAGGGGSGAHGGAAAAAAVRGLDAALSGDSTARRRALLALQGHAQALAAKRGGRAGAGGARPVGDAGAARDQDDARRALLLGGGSAPAPGAGAARVRDAAWHRLQHQVAKLQQRAALLGPAAALPAGAGGGGAGGTGGTGGPLVSPFAALASGDDPPPLFGFAGALTAAPAPAPDVAAPAASPAAAAPPPLPPADGGDEADALGPLPRASLSGLPALPADGSAHRILRAHSSPGPADGAGGALAQAASGEWVMDIAPPTRVTTRVSAARARRHGAFAPRG
jgi:hypothetical protein